MPKKYNQNNWSWILKWYEFYVIDRKYRKTIWLIRLKLVGIIYKKYKYLFYRVIKFLEWFECLWLKFLFK